MTNIELRGKIQSATRDLGTHIAEGRKLEGCQSNYMNNGNI